MNKAKGSLWAEVRSDYFCTEISEIEGDALAFVSIDGWKTADDNEQGEVLAKVALSKHGDIIVDFHNNGARFDPKTEEAIQGAKDQLQAYYLDLQKEKSQDNIDKLIRGALDKNARETLKAMSPEKQAEMIARLQGL